MKGMLHPSMAVWESRCKINTVKTKFIKHHLNVTKNTLVSLAGQFSDLSASHSALSVAKIHNVHVHVFSPVKLK
jgi:hypothetical protein